ncbi:DUF4232 domain-containing protein [Massilia sp. R2A-15]|uniref:DUF4232 domain-containing protein n=1 Tax=Massilia sp. R2A-15 TaxID=3064278 RepID=UPI002733DF0D|nr:DUF4232 domain-containing protein [Massilia sp. R2A-15]WLI90781.1 DUF4232 domain-containing protein [Massilia sp. R2A-15]
MSTRSKFTGGLSAMSVLMLSLAGQAHGAQPVPFLNQPAAAKAAATPAAAGFTHPCSGADLAVAAGPAGAYRGHATQEIRLTNNGAATCHLPGFPSAQLQPVGEAPQTVGASDLAPQLANERIELAPGESALMLMGTPGSCDAAAKPQRKVSRQLQLALPGGGVKVLNGVHVDTLCGRASVIRFHRVQNDGAAKAVSPLEQLAGSVSVADDASRGAMLAYTVTLSNPTAAPISLASCPAYTQSLYADGKSAATTLRLNCGAAGGQIPANSSVSFAMQAQVPADFAPGSLKLSWKLEDGPGAGKMINLR